MDRQFARVLRIWDSIMCEFMIYELAHPFANDLVMPYSLSCCELSFQLLVWENVDCNFFCGFGAPPGVFCILQLFTLWTYAGRLPYTPAIHPLNVVAVGGKEGHIREPQPRGFTISHPLKCVTVAYAPAFCNIQCQLMWISRLQCLL